MKEHGLDMADLSLGFNTDAMVKPPMNEVGFMVERSHRVRREVGLPVMTSWNLGQPRESSSRKFKRTIIIQKETGLDYLSFAIVLAAIGVILFIAEYFLPTIRVPSTSITCTRIPLAI